MGFLLVFTPIHLSAIPAAPEFCARSIYQHNRSMCSGLYCGYIGYIVDLLRFTHGCQSVYQFLILCSTVPVPFYLTGRGGCPPLRLISCSLGARAQTSEYRSPTAFCLISVHGSANGVPSPAEIFQSPLISARALAKLHGHAQTQAAGANLSHQQPPYQMASDHQTPDSRRTSAGRHKQIQASRIHGTASHHDPSPCWLLHFEVFIFFFLDIRVVRKAKEIPNIFQTTKSSWTWIYLSYFHVYCNMFLGVLWGTWVGFIIEVKSWQLAVRVFSDFFVFWGTKVLVLLEFTLSQHVFSDLLLTW